MRRTGLGAAVVLALGCGAAGCGASGTPGGQPPATQPAGQQPGAARHTGPSPVSLARLLHTGAAKFVGVEAPGAPDSLSGVRDFAASIGRKPDLLGQYVAWGSALDRKAAVRAWSYGALYYVAWEPYGTTLAAIARGASNGYVTAFARAVRALHRPVAISFGHEMNGNWYPWGTTGATAAQFVAAWRLLHALFAAAGATNVIWIWNPNIINPAPQVGLRAYYPGDSYVDWVGLTGYFPKSGLTTFGALFGPTMREISQFTSRPFLIAETSVESGPLELACARSLIRGVRRHRDVLGFVWFEYDKAGVDWRLQSRPPLQSVLARDVARLPIVRIAVP
jgi:hypothetical protein